MIGANFFLAPATASAREDWRPTYGKVDRGVKALLKKRREELALRAAGAHPDWRYVECLRVERSQSVCKTDRVSGAHSNG